MRIVEFVDIYPTLSELAGLPLPGHLEGTSLEPVLESQTPVEDRRVQPVSAQAASRRRSLMGYSMRTDRYRFTVWVDRTDHSKVDATELYDHQTDPQENTNIANLPANAKLVQKLMAQWKQAGRARNRRPRNCPRQVFDKTRSRPRVSNRTIHM